MYLIEKLSNRIAGEIASTLKLDKDHEEVLAYGAFNLIETLLSIILVLLFGLLFDVLLEASIISFTSAILRKYSGGAHATSPNRCAVIGVIVSVGPALIIGKINTYENMIFISCILIFVLAYYIIYKYAPVDTLNKPIKKEERKRRFKKQSIILLSVYLITIIIVAIAYFKTKNITLLNSIASIQLGVLWQSITLTFLGHMIIHKLDESLRILVSLGGGENNEK
ncbi:accessory gene regulator B family protein [Lutibacter sp. B2]|nr:accessory gene regulator B family protein [Lutibacter sp. B2]